MQAKVAIQAVFASICSVRVDIIDGATQTGIDGKRPIKRAGHLGRIGKDARTDDDHP